MTKLASILISQQIHEKPYPIALTRKYILGEQKHTRSSVNQAKHISSAIYASSRTEVQRSDNLVESQTLNALEGARKPSQKDYEVAEGSGKKTTHVDIPKLPS